MAASASTKKEKKVDLGQLMLLTDMKKTYQVSKKLCRISFALLCGMLFHLAHFSKDAHMLNLQLFALLTLVLYKALDLYEDYAFTNPIKVRKLLFRSLFNNDMLCWQEIKDSAAKKHESIDMG